MTVEFTPHNPPALGRAGSREPGGSRIVEPTTPPALFDVLVQSDGAKSYQRRRVVERFRRLGTERFGLWWDFNLGLPVDEIAPDDAKFIRIVWDQWIAGEQPFRSRRRV